MYENKKQLIKTTGGTIPFQPLDFELGVSRFIVSPKPLAQQAHNLQSTPDNSNPR